MSEYIGSRISLISKSDIRYVGTLVEINSENSTVALENVMSYGTEDRRTGDDAFPPSASLYDYILFRGSDVKDLRIEEPPKEASPAQPPQMPNDPAILGSARPPKATPTQQSNQPAPPGPQTFPPHPPHFNQFGPPYGGMPPQAFGRGFPSGPGFSGYPNAHFGPGGSNAPPGWYPQPGQGYPPGHLSPPGPGIPPGAPGQPGKGPAQQSKEQKPVEKDTDTKAPEPIPTAKTTASASTKDITSAPPAPVESKPDVAAALAPPAMTKAPIPSAPKARVMPAVPLAGQKTATASSGAAASAAQTAAAASQQATAQQAAAAVAAAMAKLPISGKAPPVPQPQNNGVDNLTRKLNEMRTNEATRQPRHPSQNTRGSFRGRGRGGHQGKVEIPTTDFDFESANKKFNKEGLAKEAHATNTGSSDLSQANGGSTAIDISEPSAVNGSDDVIIPPAQPYDKSKSFFDNISSELRDREEKKSFGGPEFRSEERRKNIETFGQGSVDGYRGAFRGRGRGRGRGGRGGVGFRGRGAPRGRGGASTSVGS